MASASTEVSGLRWQNVGLAEPSRGQPLLNAALEAALRSRSKFSPEEWASFGVSALRADHYVKVDATYFKPYSPTLMCAKACREVLDTEQSYVRVLETIVEVFGRPLSTWAAEDERAGGGGGGASPSEVLSIFGDIEMLLPLNSELCRTLAACWAEHGGAAEEMGHADTAALARAIARTLSKAASEALRMYAPYVGTFERLCERCQRLRETRPRFAAAVRVLELQPRTNGLTLQALITNTVQRLPRYKMLLSEILQHARALAEQTAASADEALKAELSEAVGALEGAIHKVHAVTLGVNTRLGDAERRARAMEVARNILKMDDLVAPSRQLLREGTVAKLQPGVFTGVRRSSRQAFLFNDLLVLYAAARQLTRALPLNELMILAKDLSYTPQTGIRALEPHHFEQALLICGIETRSIDAEHIGATFIVAAPGKGNVLALRAADAAERRAWLADVLRAVIDVSVRPSLKPQDSAALLAAAVDSESDGEAEMVPSPQYVRPAKPAPPPPQPAFLSGRRRSSGGSTAGSWARLVLPGEAPPNISGRKASSSERTSMSCFDVLEGASRSRAGVDKDAMMPALYAVVCEAGGMPRGVEELMALFRVVTHAPAEVASNFVRAAVGNRQKVSIETILASYFEALPSSPMLSTSAPAPAAAAPAAGPAAAAAPAAAERPPLASSPSPSPSSGTPRSSSAAYSPRPAMYSADSGLHTDLPSYQSYRAATTNELADEDVAKFAGLTGLEPAAAEEKMRRLLSNGLTVEQILSESYDADATRKAVESIETVGSIRSVAEESAGCRGVAPPELSIDEPSDMVALTPDEGTPVSSPVSSPEPSSCRTSKSRRSSPVRGLRSRSRSRANQTNQANDCTIS